MHKRNIILALSILFSVAFIPVFAQNNDPATASSGDADAYFSQEDFEDALEAYLTLVDKYPDNELYNYRVGVCYLNTNIDKTKAIPYLEVSTHMKKHSPNALYLLGRAYQYAYRFDDAIKTFGDFKTEGKGAAENIKDADVQIQYCMNAKELMKFPVNVTFENLGKNINS
ncbi:MAG TPA: tetratricopeptide repeat protein, partial [Bacteroidia bacterium]|nr:tetratricopeptide repeat protein [Bacteroidia bacterium]